MEDDLRQTKEQNKDLYELNKKKAKIQGVMVKANNSARSSTKDKEREEKRHRMTKQPMAVASKLDEVRKQKQAEQRTQREEMEDELQQIKGQNVQTRKSQFKRDSAAKEKVRKGKRHVRATTKAALLRMENGECYPENIIQDLKELEQKRS